MPEIFISYRREDSSGHAGRIFDCMRGRFNDESVFMDVTDIQPGVDFTKALDTALQSCRVVLVVIGTQWLTATDSSGRRRLDDPPEDHLRLEIVRALAADVHVIPVLVRGAAMPREHDLPDDVRPLAHRQAHELSDSRWTFDTNQLLRIVESDLGATDRGDCPTRANAPTPRVHRAAAPLQSRLRMVWPAAVLLGLLGLIAARVWWPGGDRGGKDEPPVSGGPGAGGQAGGVPAAPSAAFSTAARENAPARLPAGGEVRAGGGMFKLLGGLVSRGGGTHTVRFFVRTTNVGARNGIVISPESFRLIVEGRPTAPTEAPILVVPFQSANEGWVVFPVPSNAGSVVFQVGDVRQQTAKIPIDLRSVGAGLSDTPSPTWRYPVDLAATFVKRVGPLVFHLDGARLEHFSDAVPPLQPERLLLSFKLRIENAGSQNGTVVSSDLFRLLVDEVPLAPTKAPIAALQYQTSLEGDVEFVMPGSATNAFLQVGSLSGQTAKVSIESFSGALNRTAPQVCQGGQTCKGLHRIRAGTPGDRS